MSYEKFWPSKAFCCLDFDLGTKIHRNEGESGKTLLLMLFMMRILLWDALRESVSWSFFRLIFLQLISRHLIFARIELMDTWSCGQVNFSILDLSTHDLWLNWPLWPLAFLQMIFSPFDLIYIWTHIELILLHLIFFQLIFLMLDLFAHWSLCQLIFLQLIFSTIDLFNSWSLLRLKNEEWKWLISNIF